MRHLMLDLETFGTTPGCVIRSIGAVCFDLDGELGDEFYSNIDAQSCLDAELFIEDATERWWAKQPAEAHLKLEKNQKSLPDVVSEFNQWFLRTGSVYVWSQGANFDGPLWDAASRAVGKNVPWKYWNARDTRTVYHTNKFNPRSLPRDGVHHNAVDDAKFQISCVVAALKNNGAAG